MRLMDYITLEEIEKNIKNNISAIQRNIKGKDKITYQKIEGTNTSYLMNDRIKLKPQKVKKAFLEPSSYRQDWQNRKVIVSASRNKIDDIIELPVRTSNEEIFNTPLSQYRDESIGQEYPVSRDKVFNTLHNYYSIKLTESRFKFYIREGLISPGQKIIEKGILGSRSSYKNKTIELLVIIDCLKNKIGLKLKDIKYYFRIINFQEHGVLSSIIMWKNLKSWPIHLNKSDPNFQKKIKKIKEGYIEAHKMYWDINRVIFLDALAELVSRENDLRRYLKWEEIKKIKFHLSFDEVYFALHLKEPINRTITISCPCPTLSKKKIEIFKLKP